MKQSTLLTFLILIPFFIYGQKTNRWTGKNFYIKPKPKNQDFVGRTIYISKIIDKRLQKKYLGTVDKNGLIYMAKFEKPFENAIQDIFATMYPFRESYIPVTVYVHKFLIEERTKKGLTTVDLEFFPIDTTKKSFRIKQSLEVEGTEITKKHHRVIVDLLLNCFKKANVKTNELLATKQIVQQGSLKATFPIRKGIYNNFLGIALQQAVPNVPITIVKREHDKIERFEIKYLNRDHKKVKHAFAASDGKDLYLNFRSFYHNLYKNSGKRNPYSTLVDGYYLKAKLYGRFIYFEDRVSSNTAAFMFGTIGALASMRKVGFVLDIKDGTIHSLDTEFLSSITFNKPDLKKTYNNSEKSLEDKKAVIKVLNDNALE